MRLDVWEGSFLFDPWRSDPPAARRLGALRFSPRAMRLYVVRHAQSANNALAHPSLMNPDRDSDPSLTEVGFKQAECVARFLKEEYGAGAERCAVENRIGRLYSSPMRRCMLTSAPIARELGLDITVRGDIFEHGGCFEGSADGAVKGRPGMGTEQLEREFPGCVVPAELDKGWWKESRGVETVEEVRASTETPAVARHTSYSFPPTAKLNPVGNPTSR